MESSPAQLVVSSSFAHASPARIRHRRIAGQTMTVLAPSRPSIPVGVLKSGLDRIAALFLLTVLAPLMIGLAILIRLDSPGSAVYRQVRIGRGGRPFTMYKFRSMGIGADAVKHLLRNQDEGNGVLFKVHADPRVTRVGRLCDGPPSTSFRSWSTFSRGKCPWSVRGQLSRRRSPAMTTGLGDDSPRGQGSPACGRSVVAPTWAGRSHWPSTWTTPTTSRSLAISPSASTPYKPSSVEEGPTRQRRRPA